MAEPHFEKYKVTSKLVVADTMTLGVKKIVVPDSPAVGFIKFKDFRPGGCTSLTGSENPVDQIAMIYAEHEDWQDAVDAIQINTYFIRYQSTPGALPHSEDISDVSWGLIT